MSINYLGVKTLYKKEVLRFLKVYNQTLIAPVVNALLLLAVFMLAFDGNHRMVADISFAQFMASGLIIMIMVQNSFANSSSSFVMGKVMGNIIDYLMPPLSSIEITISMTLAAVTRAIMVGIIGFVVMKLFLPIGIHSLSIVIIFAILSSFMLGLLGLLCGIFSDSFDQMSAITSYLITPLSFLSGTFYSIKNLPTFWYNLSHLNPFFYMIDGFRYGMTGYSDSSYIKAMIILFITNIALVILVNALIKKGYRIKN